MDDDDVLQANFDRAMQIHNGATTELGFNSEVSVAIASYSMNPSDPDLKLYAEEAFQRQLSGKSSRIFMNLIQKYVNDDTT